METQAGKTKREKKEEDMRRGLQDDLGRVEEEATGARKKVCRARGLSQGGTLKVDKNTGQDNGKAKIEDILPSSSAAGVVEENAMEVVDLVSDEDEGFDLAGVGEVGKEAIPAERDNISDEEIDDLLKSDDEDDLTQSSTSIKVRQTSSIQAPPLPLLSEQLMSLIKTKEAPPSSHSKRSSSLRRSPNKSPSLKRSASLGRNHPKRLSWKDQETGGSLSEVKFITKAKEDLEPDSRGLRDITNRLHSSKTKVSMSEVESTPGVKETMGEECTDENGNRESAKRLQWSATPKETPSKVASGRRAKRSSTNAEDDCIGCTGTSDDSKESVTPDCHKIDAKKARKHLRRCDLGDDCAPCNRPECGSCKACLDM